ncbi:hypothetical protein ACFY7H_33955 [Streptomyces sp. NPDC012794]|uniref:hypothetical protein n=1 Tax=Streptomyces sp. NPDC012794 TaxID=3364850 RepID=UPI00368BD44C
MSLLAQDLVAHAGHRRAAAVASDAASGAVPEPTPAPVPAPGMVRLFAPLRQAPLGLLALVQSAAVAWTVYGRTEAPPPQPGDHAWWHSSGPVEAEAFRPGLFLALATVAFYLTLPLLAVAAQVLRRHGGRLVRAGGRTLTAQLAFTAAATAVGSAVTVPLVVLARAFSPVDVGPLGSAIAADAVTALRLCALAGLLLVFAVGVPWAAKTGAAPYLRRESGSD